MSQSKLTADFSSLALSIASSCMMSIDGTQEQNFEVAQFNIELLRMLRDKTKNNLTAEEGRFLDSLLNEIQLKFVSAKRK